MCVYVNIAEKVVVILEKEKGNKWERVREREMEREVMEREGSRKNVAINSCSHRRTVCVCICMCALALGAQNMEFFRG